MSERAGLLVRAGEDLGFVSAEIARKVVPLPQSSPVANTPLAMALVSGQVLPVVAIGSPTGVLLVCEIDGELVGFSGLAVERAGAFPAADGGVLVDERKLSDLDLEGALRSLDLSLEPRLGASP